MTGRIRLLLALAALSGFLAIAAGAFSQHGAADPAVREWLKTGGSYGLVQALAVFAAFALVRAGARFAEAAGWLLLAGGLLFAGSLDLMAVTANHALAIATPIGGLVMMAGWLTLAASAIAGPKPSAP